MISEKEFLNTPLDLSKQKNGVYFIEISNKQGKKIGKHIGYWEKGNLKFEYHFINGEHDGLLNEWYQSGQRYKEFHYKKGYEEGSEKKWWENGTIRANYVVKNGRRYGLIGLKLCMNPVDSIN